MIPQAEFRSNQLVFTHLVAGISSGWGVGFSVPVTRAVAPAHKLSYTLGTVAFAGIKPPGPVFPIVPSWHFMG